jgi:hypothetical protein
MRDVAVLLFLGTGLVFAQAPGLPATPPTTGQPPAAVSAPAPNKAAAAHRAEVTYSGRKLEVTADNSSLNQILRQIARATGMKITGGVADERVYGKYGPGPAAQVLNSLLDGTGSNIFLRGADRDTPGELILTPRNGGPTPPNPSAAGFDDSADEPATAQQAVPAVPAPAAPPVAAAPVVAPADPGAVPPPPPPPAAGTTDAPPAPPSDTASPNGVKTPQQIYEELQKLHHQQPANPQ